ncbi:MAG: ADP-ribosylglycohydrolase family protein [Oscillospiraceae bacterium]
MYGAILGDIVGSPYEFDCNNYKAKDFPLFSQQSEFTDDTVMTLAVAKALMDTRGQDDAAIKAALVREMQRLGCTYPDRGYGVRFGGWLYEDAPKPYNSYGNGSAMRVSPAAWLGGDMEEVLHLARLTAEVTHNHSEGIKGAQATAAAIYLARTGHSKADIKAYVEREFGYDLSRTCDKIRPTYHHVESCQETVPQAITAFLESTDFEDASPHGGIPRRRQRHSGRHHRQHRRRVLRRAGGFEAGMPSTPDTGADGNSACVSKQRLSGKTVRTGSASPKFSCK